MSRYKPWMCVLFIAGIMMSQVPLAWAGAWTLPRNRWYAEYYYQFFGAKKSFDSEGHSTRKAKHAIFQDLRNEFKLEYGLLDWVNVLASVPYQSSHYRDDNVDLLTTGVGDIYTRVKLRWLEQPVVSSVQFSWKIPSAYNPNESPALGKGQFDFESRVQISKSFVFSPYQVSRRTGSTASAPASPTPAAGPSRTAIMEQKLETREHAMREALMASRLHEDGKKRAAQSSGGLMPEAEAAEHPGGAAAMTPPSPARQDAEVETRYARVAYLDLEGGFTARREERANEFPLLFEAGITPIKRVMLVGSLESVISVKSTHEQTEDYAQWGLRGIFNVWGDGFPAVFRRLEKDQPTVNVEVGYNDIFAGRNTDDAIKIFGKVSTYF